MLRFGDALRHCERSEAISPIMKKLFLLFVMLNLFQHRVVAQVLAGQHLFYYRDIDPDTILQSVCNAPSEEFYTDLDNNTTTDILIEASCDASPSHTITEINITPVNSDFYILTGQKDSVLTPSVGWLKISSAKALYYGDTINNVDAYWSNQQLAICASKNFFGTGVSANYFSDSVDRYVGVKYQSSLDTIYGWIRLICPYLGQCIIKDYSLGPPVSTGIESEKRDFRLFPNPATTQLTITGYTPAYLKLCNTLGQTVAEASNTNTLWLGTLPKGLYVLQLFDAKGGLVKAEKVVKE